MAKVVKTFRGVPDGQSRVQEFHPGDIVTGDLAAVAVREGWATVPKADKAAEEAPAAKQAAADKPKSKATEAKA